MTKFFPYFSRLSRNPAYHVFIEQNTYSHAQIIASTENPFAIRIIVDLVRNLFIFVTHIESSTNAQLLYHNPIPRYYLNYHKYRRTDYQFLKQSSANFCGRLNLHMHHF